MRNEAQEGGSKTRPGDERGAQRWPGAAGWERAAVQGARLPAPLTSRRPWGQRSFRMQKTSILF